MRILVDLDGTLTNLTEAVLHRINEELGTDFVRDDLPGWSFTDLPGVTPSLVDHIFDDRFIWMYLDWLPGAQEGITRLLEAGHDLHIVTTPANSESAWGKYWWCQENLGFDCDRVTLTKDKSKVRGDMLIDDKPSNLESFPGHAVGLRYPYNQDCRRCHLFEDWETMATYIEEVDSAKR